MSGQYSASSARRAASWPRRAASLQRATAPCSVRSRVQRLLVYSRRGPEGQHDDDFDHRANSLESHLHRSIALVECDGGLAAICNNLAMLTTLLTADSTARCEFCLVCTSRASVSNAIATRFAAAGQGSDHIFSHTCCTPRRLHACGAARRTARPGESVDGIESRRRHVGR